MSILVARRTIYQVIRIRALNHRGWTFINGVYVFDSLYINHGYNYGRVSRMNTDPYMYHHNNNNNNDGVSWMNNTSYMYHNNNNNDGVSWMNTTPYMDHGNNNNNNNGRVLKVNPAPQDSIQNLERFTIERGLDSSSMSSCSICLDEIPVGSEATRMPCSHVYHNHCIVKWLETCNTCPLCRSAI